MPDIERTLSAWVIRHRWWFLVLAPIMVLILAGGIGNAKFKTDYRVFFSEDNPQLKAFDRLENTYAQNDNVVFLLVPKDGQVFTRKTLAVVEQLTEMAWQLPYSLRVDSISNFQHTEANGDDLVVRDLVSNATQLSDAEIERIRKISLAEPLLVERLVPKEGKVTIVNVTIQLPRMDETREGPEVVIAARKIADRIRALYPHLDVHLSGIVVMNNAFYESSMNDLAFLGPISFGVMIVALVLLLRGFMGTFATFLVIVMSILAGMGAGIYSGIFITSPSSTAPIIILTMAIANSVHILVVFYHELHSGIGRQAAMQESLRINLYPIFLTSLTTVIGFLSLNLSDVPPFRDLGNLVAIGVCISFLLSVTFLPTLMTLLPARTRCMGSDDRIMDYFGDFVVRHRHWLLRSVGVMIVTLIAFIPRNELNDVYVRYFDESIDFRRDTDILNEHLGGLYWIDYSLDSDESNGIHDPAFLGKVDAFVAWLRQQPEVTHVNTITDIFKRLNKDLHGGDPSWYRLPDKRDFAAQCLLLYEMSLPYGLDLNNQINVDKSATRVTVSTQVLSTKKVLDLAERARRWISENAPTLATQGAGPTMMFAHIGARNIQSMLIAAALALVLISLILILTLRSLKIGFTSMIPNLVPAGMAFGVWGILVGEIGLALSVVASMTLGIVVDDTIHFLSKYLRARREQHMSPENAVRYAFSHVGMALMITSFALISGFLILALSSFYLNSSMGLMTAMILFMALLADFLFLPPLLMRIEKN
uniref:SSD domain-containing protein n=1 Tax=Candidatus Kentrum sp. TUN TaxID=2126343 RepID=A0A450ZDA5_9GAMM|nr:MAG: hypothetical protein BECKTUN1418D_GA0071000_10111 [Candidatus Kentron sp. TUN]VFK54587.1 MAG: hypothetical protein BECKTUN1418F_GA0071002_104715 [Candidatus Kentron sp. TUN]VFK57627.1 MAG: hypothetical protein BECKTUN1418E_GA0071001_104615 [Candidatus Kentron sp. TUN]